MNVKEYLKNEFIILDGGMGTLLQENGLTAGELPERWNVTHPEIIQSVHKAYFDAGSNVVVTNTFGANIFKLSENELEEVIKSAVENAKKAKAQSQGTQEKWIALDIGPTGKMLAPYGDLDFEDAVEAFAKTVRLGVKYGVDCVLIETMTDSYETKCAVLAVKENANLPVFVCNAYGEDGRLMTGANAQATVAMLEGLGVDAIGVNCSFGPKQLAPVVEEYLKYASLPVIVKPNAGLPSVVDGKTAYDVTPEDFAKELANLAKKGVRVAGGCCGTTPAYIKSLSEKLRDIQPLPITEKPYALVSSYTHAVQLGEQPILIGERINPTGKKKLKEALKAGDIDYILKEAVAQQEKGVHLLDVNVGLPEMDEEKTLKEVVCRLQAITNLPLQIDTSSVPAMESALRRYNGKAMVNSVNGKKESMDAVFPLVKKYGGLVVCLTLDEQGIPESAEGRLKIAEKILKKANEYGIAKKNLIFDPLALSVSADKNAGKETLKAVKRITEELGAHTSLGVSNVSFGLPQRDILNSAFFTTALSNGLSCAIMNPYSDEMMKAYYAFRALSGLDENFLEYMHFVDGLPAQTVSTAVQPKKETESVTGSSPLQTAVIKGLTEQAVAITKQLLGNISAMDIIEKEIIPALDTVGKAYESKQVYLPQLLMSAEASKASFACIKESMNGKKTANKCAFVIATVKGDIHDIGKNIVKLLLENYGFAVHDLGKDVSPEQIVAETVRQKAPIVGLSALMTTTLPAMEQTVRLLREKAPWCKIVVGGAVLNEEYANKIGADKYAKDAFATVRYAEQINALL